jgi:hypothetical protein
MIFHKAKISSGKDTSFAGYSNSISITNDIKRLSVECRRCKKCCRDPILKPFRSFSNVRAHFFRLFRFMRNALCSTISDSNNTYHLIIR